MRCSCKRLFAEGYKRVEKLEHRMYHPFKGKLLTHLSGDILEIGPGVGNNLQYLSKDSKWIGVEPNPAMHPYIEEKLASFGLNGTLYLHPAENLQEIPDRSQDYVISTLVLCSVNHLQEALSEIFRVLKVGGRFLFLEHVADEENILRSAIQKSITPAWKIIGDGCHLDRTTGSYIQKMPFSDTHIEKRSIGSRLSPARPHIMGWAQK
ncbi:MAG: class I SAM-dependent methyltransferase [Bacteroidota bacterium]